MQDELHTLLKKLVIKNNIHLHQEELKTQLLTHPSYIYATMNNADTEKRMSRYILKYINYEKFDSFIYN